METEKIQIVFQNAFNSEMVNCYHKRDRCIRLGSKKVLDKFLKLLAE